jgi:hypothetical protein
MTEEQQNTGSPEVDFQAIPASGSPGPYYDNVFDQPDLGALRDKVTQLETEQVGLTRRLEYLEKMVNRLRELGGDVPTQINGLRG